MGSAVQAENSFSVRVPPLVWISCSVSHICVTVICLEASISPLALTRAVHIEACQPRYCSPLFLFKNFLLYKYWLNLLTSIDFELAYIEAPSEQKDVR